MSTRALNGTIILNRGDSIAFDIDLPWAACRHPKYYHIQDTDAVYFGIMDPGMPFEYALVRKKFTNDDIDHDTGKLKIVLRPEDTLDLMPGKYFYAVKLHLNHDCFDNFNSLDFDTPKDHVLTVVNKTKFILCD